MDPRFDDRLPDFIENLVHFNAVHFSFFFLVCFIIGYPDSALPFFRPFPKLNSLNSMPGNVLLTTNNHFQILMISFGVLKHY